MSTLKFDPESPVIVVETRINASLPTIARFVVDTGASFVTIPRNMATAIGIKIDPTKRRKITTATAVEMVPEVVISEMSVLGKVVKNVKAIVKNLPPGTFVDRLLGLSFLKHFKLSIDFQKGEMTLE